MGVFILLWSIISSFRVEPYYCGVVFWCCWCARGAVMGVQDMGSPLVRLLTEEVRPHPLGALCQSVKECSDKSWIKVDKERPCIAPLLFQVAQVFPAMVTSATRLYSLRLVMLVFFGRMMFDFRWGMGLGWGSGGGPCLPPMWGGRWSGSRISWGTSLLEMMTTDWWLHRSGCDWNFFTCSALIFHNHLSAAFTVMLSLP